MSATIGKRFKDEFSSSGSALSEFLPNLDFSMDQATAMVSRFVDGVENMELSATPRVERKLHQSSNAVPTVALQTVPPRLHLNLVEDDMDESSSFSSDESDESDEEEVEEKCELPFVRKRDRFEQHVCPNPSCSGHKTVMMQWKSPDPDYPFVYWKRHQWVGNNERWNGTPITKGEYVIDPREVQGWNL